MLTQLLRPSSSSQDPATAMATESVSGTLAKAVETAAEEGNVEELRWLRVGEDGGGEGRFFSPEHRSPILPAPRVIKS